MTPEPAVTLGPAGSGVVGDWPVLTRMPAAGVAGPQVRYLFSGRSGGVSRPPYDSFNLGGHVGDDPVAVTTNRGRLAVTAGLPAAALIWMNQVHGTTVLTVGRAELDTAGGAVRSTLPDCDGLVTSATGLGLAVLVADCVPMLFADPVAGVIGAVHAGRRGAADGIALRTLDAMAAAGSSLDAVQVLLGPSICGRCYEVPARMRDEVEAALPGSAVLTDERTPGLDLRAGLAQQLSDAGVGSVSVDSRCTRTDLELFSHRRGAPTGRLAGLIWMQQQP